jgi:amino acid adenylation domain-containing protein
MTPLNKVDRYAVADDPDTRGHTYPASFPQERYWVLSQLCGRSPAFHLCRAYWVPGPVNVQTLDRCLRALVQRHWILRSSFRMVGNRLVQIVHSDANLHVELIDLECQPVPDLEESVRKLVLESVQQSFDVTKAPLVRCEVYRLCPTHHLLLFVLHCLVADEPSLDELLEELTSLYDAFQKGTVPALAENKKQYAEWAQWQREQTERGLLKAQLSYWLKRLSSPLPVLELPLDHTRPAVQTLIGARQTLQLTDEITLGIRGLSEETGVDASVILLAAFYVFLHRYTSHEDILVGARVDGRHNAATRGMIGPLANILVTRTPVADNPTFRALLAKVALVLAEAHAHQDVPVETLLRVMKPKRNLVVPPLFQVMYAFHRRRAQTFRFGEITLSPMGLTNVASVCDLTLSPVASEHHMSLSMDYSPDMFEVRTIERMLGQCQLLLRGIITNPETRILQLPLLTGEELHQVLVEWNDTSRDFPRNKCVHQLIEESVRRSPRAVAVEYGGKCLSYGELNDCADQLASLLRSAEVGPEVVVPICVERSLEMVIGVLGILKAGGAYLPLDPAYPRERLGLMLEDCQARVIVTQPQLREIFSGQNRRLICLNPNGLDDRTAHPTSPACQLTPDNLAYVIYTSGTTGRPKGVLVTHRSVVHSTYARFLEYDQRVESFLLLSSYAFDSSVAGIFWTLCQGGRLVLPLAGQERNPDEWGRIVSRHAVSHLLCLPSLYALLLRRVQTEELRSLKLVIVAGEACPPELPGEHDRKLPSVRLYNEYGPTEYTVWSTVYRLDGKPGRDTVPIGRPIANTQTYILDMHHQPVPIGVPGELYLGGEGLARGYLNQSDLTAEKFIPNPFDSERTPRLYRTGDRARYLPDGDIAYLGRVDSQVKVRGLRIELGEIEAVLATHPAVIENVAKAREVTRGVKRLVVYVTCRMDSSASELRAFLKARLPEYMVPSAFVFLDSFPRTPSGKIDRGALPGPDPLPTEVGGEFECPTNPVQTHLAKIWEKMLGLHPIGIKSNFFELGGDSLLAALVCLEIEQQLSTILPLAALVQAPTIEQLADLLHRVAEVRAWSSLVAIQPHGSRPPLYLMHGLGGNIVGYAALARHLGLDQPVFGLQSWGLSGRHSPHTRIEEMATHYLAEISALQPQGPYFLGGLSFGGLVAFEMAQQLHAQGRPVGLVALLDTYFEGKLDCLTRSESLARRLRLTQQRLGGHAHDIRELNWSNFGTYFRKKANILKTRLASRLRQTTCTRKDSRGASISESLQSVWEANLLAAKRYRPKIYPGSLTLFRAGTPVAEEFQWDHWTAWRCLAIDGVTLHFVPGDHNTMVREPHVKVLAEKLRALLVASGSPTCGRRVQGQAVQAGGPQNQA